MALSRSAAAVAPAALIALASTASAGFDVFVDFSFEIWNFNGNVSHNLFPQVNVGNFSDPFHPDNDFELISPTGLFSGGPNGSSSTALPSPGDVISEANAGFWMLTVTDGLSGDVRTFEFEIFVDSDLDDPEYWRQTSITNYAMGDMIPQSPTFEWAVDPAGFSDAEYDSISTVLFGDVFDFDTLSGSDTMWTPNAAPLPVDAMLSFAITHINEENRPSSLLDLFSGPNATDGGDELSSFDYSFQLGSLAAITELKVVPAPGALALAGFAGIVGLRRRR